ncbi:peroxiredoxin-2E-1, chloroplastic-like [Syzygium oleosum]|uniref:peroxiredoxin-2E-1, chloroplastic-like n=1 Tax=Syzygium oleosum TaxID=219896 RepID=UPI0024BB5E16|nr:peroxiredoxin-2E-1, chloroplastic-like [Syzygium oleosum]
MKGRPIDTLGQPISLSVSLPSLALRRRSSPLAVPRRRSPGKPLRLSTAATRAAISVGDRLPDATLSNFDPASKLQTTTVSALTAGKKSILFAVPGPSPRPRSRSTAGARGECREPKAKGVGNIACISVNDAFMMRAWKENLGIGDDVMLLSDGNGDFTRAIGCELDLSDQPVGLGVRLRRYALLAKDGIVKVLNLEEGGAFTFSGAEDMLKVL